jgi:hypothetical protein
MLYEKGFNISRSRMALCATPLQNCSASLAGVSAAAWQDDAPTQKNRQSNNLCPRDFRFWPPDDWQRCAFVSRENGTDVKFACVREGDEFKQDLTAHLFIFTHTHGTRSLPTIQAVIKNNHRS